MRKDMRTELYHVIKTVLAGITVGIDKIACVAYFVAILA